MSTTICKLPAAHVAASDTDGVIEVTLSRALKVWWSLFWRQNLYTLALAFVCGAMIGIIGAAAGMKAPNWLLYLSGAVVGALVSIEATWIVLRKSWSDFRIVLVANHPRESPDPQYPGETRSISVTVSPDLLKLSVGVPLVGLGMTGLVAFVVRGLSFGWIIVVVTGVLLVCFAGALLLVAVVERQPRVEIGPEGFASYRVFDRRGRWRRWGDIEGRFEVINVGFNKGVGYHLTPHFKESAGIKPTTLFASNDEAITGAFDMPISKLAELLNRYKEHAHGDVRAAR